MFVIYTGHPAAFAIGGILMIAALTPVTRDRAARRNQSAAPSQQRSLPSAVGSRLLSVIELMAGSVGTPGAAREPRPASLAG